MYTTKIMKKMMTLKVCFLLSLVTVSTATWAGFSISGTQLLDKDGNPFVMRGVNHPHAWYNYRTAAYEHIAATGANTVRVVLSDGQQFALTTATDTERVISMCKRNRLICVLEVHDVTGSGEKVDAGNIETTVEFWIERADILKGEEDYVIINIANEPFGNGVPASTWINKHRDAIIALREAGLTHTLMVDAANWGQDWEEIMLTHASEVAAADVLNNTMFSVHMYQVYQTRDTIESYVSTFLTRHNLPLVVGEFGGDHQGEDVDEDSILAVSEEYNIGYLGWSWSGNSGCCTTLDIVINFDPQNLSPWGERLINGPNGIATTSVMAPIFEGYEPPPTLMCDWYGTIVPICNHQDEGWGQENQQNCIGITTCENQSGDGGVIGATPSPTPSISPIPTPTVIPSPSPEPSPLPTPTPQPGNVDCSHQVVNSWQGGFQGEVTILNNSATPIVGWAVEWTYVDGSTLQSSWNATVIGGNPYQASHLSWNKTIAPGQSISFGFTGNGAGTVAGITGDVCDN